ncbi:MAG: methionyl-tRNA formyltransferase [Lachnospiraceae bacterium]|nr:methionyl-tRNA formyltransferase [Lachnospiraceae bacterium]
MNVVFMGTPDFAAGILCAVADAGYHITGVVTQPDRPRGRKKEILPGPVRCEAEKRGIPVYQPLKVRAEEAVEEIRKMEPDLIIVAAFGQIIPRSILTMPIYGCINVHASLLPAYRGAAPIQRAILDGCDVTGVTIMRMNEGLDTGDIISQREVTITGETTGGSLFDELAREGASLLLDTIPSIVDGSAVYTPQPEKSTTAYASLIKKEHGCIDWSLDAVSIERMTRALSPWPSAWTTMDGRLLKIWKAHVEKRDSEGSAEETGRIVRQDARGLYIQCGRGILAAEELQLEGRRRMTAGEFLRGYTIRNNVLGQ